MEKIALELLESDDIDVFNYYIPDDYEDETEIDRIEFKKLLKNNKPCSFEIYLQVGYFVPIDYNSVGKEKNFGGFYEDCYHFPFSEKTMGLLEKIGYGKEFLKDWTKQYYGKPEYDEIWDGVTLYDEDYLDKGEEEKYQCVWNIHDYLKIELLT